MSASCAQCGAKRNHSQHLRAVAGESYHAFQDASRGGLRPVSEARRAYQSSEAHKAAYASLESVCLAARLGAPGECSKRMTAHHVFARSAAGGLKAAEAGWPVVPMCALHNDAIESDVEMRRWAERTTFEWTDGNLYPLRLTAKTARAMREAR